MRVRVTAPCRADLAGGTLDIWPLGLLHPGAVTVNTAIPVLVALEVDLEAPSGEVLHFDGDGSLTTLGSSDAGRDLTAAVALAVAPGGGVRVRVVTQAPMGSGLGGSSAYGVALARALLTLENRREDDHSVVALVRDLEARILSVPTGTQDHWPAVLGGTLALHHEPGGEQVETLAIDPRWLKRHLAVFFTGITHSSGMVNWQVIRRRFEGHRTTTSAFDEIAAAARDCRSALLVADEKMVGKAIRREWAARKLLAPEVCPAELEHLESTALGAGAAAFKACGAGGGGSVLVWHTDGARRKVLEALQTAAPDGTVLATGIAADGCTVTEI